MQRETHTKWLLGLAALVMAISSCSNEQENQTASAPPPTTEAIATDPSLSPSDEQPAEPEPISDEPEPISDEPEPISDGAAPAEEIGILVSEFVEVEILEWRRGDQGELILTISGEDDCVARDADCDDGVTDIAMVTAAEGLTRFELPVKIAPGTVETVEVSHNEFEAYLAGEPHPAAIDPQQGDRFILVLEPDVVGQDDDVGGWLRIASQIALAEGSS